MSLLLALLLAVQDKDDPAAELASFQLLDGYEANLFASERDGIANPIQCRWDERGRLWVICSWAYPQVKPGEKADDKIIVLEDTDGDGRADKKEELVGKFGFNGNGCDIHGPFLGPDGWLYWTDGRHGYQCIDRKSVV